MTVPATHKEKGSTWQGEPAMRTPGWTDITRVYRMAEGPGKPAPSRRRAFPKQVFPKQVFPMGQMGPAGHFPRPTVTRTLILSSPGTACPILQLNKQRLRDEHAVLP